MKNTCIIVAAGRGSRMGSDIPKQFMEVNGYPMLYHTIKAWEESFVDEIFVVVSEEYVESVSSDIMEKYGFKKVKGVICGGEERYISVYAGLRACQGSEYVYIHDGARPCVDRDLIDRIREAAEEYGACVAAVPVKDTIKVSDEAGFAADTPDRNCLWAVQTPQAFKYSMIRNAYDIMMNDDGSHNGERQTITDDAMVVEKYGDEKVKLVMGSYDNIKVTTPDDMEAVVSYFEKKK